MLLEAPGHLAALLGELPQGVTISLRLGAKGQFDVIVLFIDAVVGPAKALSIGG